MTTGRSQVGYLGTLHAAHLMSGYSLDIVEAAIRNFRPDVVLVEVPPSAMAEVLAEVDAVGEAAGPDTLQSQWIRPLPELYSVVLPLRHELRYDVVPVSGWTEAAKADRDAYYMQFPHGPMEREYIIANATFHAAFLQNEGAQNVAYLHGPEYLETLTDASRWLSYYAEEAMRQGGELRVQGRHAALVEEALTAFRGQRILIVFDATSRWYLEPVVRARRDVDFVSTPAFLP